VSTPTNWLSAANKCAADRPRNLVTISSGAETAFVLTLAQSIAANARLWIGGTDGRFSSDGQGSGPYSWITGEPLVYTNWFQRREPSGAGRPLLHLFWGRHATASTAWPSGPMAGESMPTRLFRTVRVRSE